MGHSLSRDSTKGVFQFFKKNFLFFSFCFFVCLCFFIYSEIDIYLLLLQIRRLREGAINLTRLLIEAADPVILL